MNNQKDINHCMPLVSIIVPVYKVEDYVERCVNSILSQTYQNLEVILVDDGSPDSCGAICDRFASHDDRVKVIHQENQGQSAARNHAALEAKGEYIVFVDSDDFISEDHVECLLKMLLKHDADIAIASLFYYYEGQPVPVPSGGDQVKEMNAEEAIIAMNYNRGFGAMPWSKIYKKELILAHPYPVGVIYEDLATTYKIFSDAQKLVYCNKRIYYWSQRAGSTMHRQFSERQLNGLKAVKEQIQFVKQKHPAVLPSAHARYVFKLIELIEIALNSTDSRQFFRMLKKEMRYAGEVLKNPHVKKSLKLRLVAVQIGYLPAKMIFAAHKQIREFAVRRV